MEAIVDEAKPRIVEALQEMDDFYVEIKWDFESWIPFISRFLPSDTCKLYKKGTKLRLDCTLGDIAAKGSANSTSNKESAANSMGANISPFKWERGDLSFIFEIEKIGTKNSIIFMDNTKKIFLIIDKTQQVAEEPDLDKEIDLLLSKEMIFLKLNTKNAIFSPTQVGWFTKRDKIEQLNGYNCQFYDVNNLFIVTKLRVEHLSDEELKKREEKQTKLKEQLSVSGGGELKKTPSDSQVNKADVADDVRGLENLKDLDMDEEIEYRPSLPPPPPNKVTWDDYISAKEGEWPCLGRKLKCKESKKEFKAQIAMSQEFPLTITDLDKLLDALVPLAKFRKLKEFISLKLPPGFPVKIGFNQNYMIFCFNLKILFLLVDLDIPIVPAISAKVCFQNFRKNCEHSQSLFTVPADYKEEVLLPETSSHEEMKSSFWRYNALGETFMFMVLVCINIPRYNRFLIITIKLLFVFFYNINIFFSKI